MAERDAGQRRKALRRGHFSEYLAALSLLLRGYRILAMRYRVKAGEIDIIARKGDLVSFIEVKARSTSADSVFAVSGLTQSRIRNASMHWLQTQKDAGGLLVLRHRRRAPLALARAFQGRVLSAQPGLPCRGPRPTSSGLSGC